MGGVKRKVDGLSPAGNKVPFSFDETINCYPSLASSKNYINQRPKIQD